MQNLSGNNSLGGPITLTSNSEINVLAGTLTLNGPVSVLSAGSATLTQAGSGMLVLAGASRSAFPSEMTVASGLLRLQNSAALGLSNTTTVVVNSGATIQMEGGIAIPGVSLALNGTGASNNGAMENLQGANSYAGNITLAGNSQVNIDNAADSLTLSGPISGNFGLTEAGNGTLVLSNTGSTFSGPLCVASGTLSVGNIGITSGTGGTFGVLGISAAPVTLGSNGVTATFLYTGTATTTNQGFYLAAGGGGVFPVNGNLNLSGIVSGNGSLTKTGSGTLTLSDSDPYTGMTTISSGTLAVSGTGALNATSGICVAQGCALQVTAGGGGGQLPNAGNITLSAATLSYFGNGSASPGETTGALLLKPGQSTVATSNAGSGTTCLCFASGAASAVIGATVNFSGSNNAQIQFQSNPPSGNGGIIGGYAFYVSGGSTDFAALTAASGDGPYTVGPCANYTSGNLGAIASSGTVNAEPSGTQSSISTLAINSLNLVGSAGVTLNSSATLTLDSGGLIGNTTGSIIGGTLMGSSSGELTVNTVENLTIGSVIADNGGPTALVKTGSGTLTLTGGDTFTGNVYLNQGTLVYAPTSNLTYGGAISGIGGLSKSGSATLTLTGSNTYSGPTTISQGHLAVNGELLSSGNVQVNNATLTGTGSVGNVFVNGGGTLAVGDGLNTMSAAALTLTASSFLTDYTSAAGYNPLAVSGAVTLPNSGVTLNLTGGSNTSGTYHLMSYGSLSGLSSSTFTIAGSPSAGDTFSVVADAGATNYLDFVISINGRWNHNGSGTWSSSGNWANNNVPGGTALDTAVFGPVLSSGTATVTLDSNRSVSSLGFSTTAAGASYVIAASAGSTLALANPAGSAATISDSGGNHTVGAAITLGSNLSVSVTSGSVLTIAGGIGQGGGNQSLSVSGGGELILSGTDTYTGGTTVSGGTLEFASPSAMPTTGIIIVGRSGTVNLTSLLAAYLPQVAGEESTLGAAANPEANGDAVETADEGTTTGGGATTWPADDPGGTAGGEIAVTTAGIQPEPAGVQSVPEPGTLVLTLAALVALGLVLRIKGGR